MKKLTYILLLSLSIQICFAENSQNKPKEKTEKLTSVFESNQNEPSQYDAYSESLGNNVITNSSLGSSKYDKDINIDADIDSNDVEGSLERYRDKKQSEEIKNILTILFFILIASGIAYIVYIGFFKTETPEKK